MPVEKDGQTYYTAAEAAKYLGISRPTFYKNVQPNIRDYEYGSFKRVYYRKADLDQYKEMRDRHR